MLKISTTAVCPKCGGTTVWYEDGKFVCYECGRKHTSKEVIENTNGFFEIVISISKQEFLDKFQTLLNLSGRFNADECGYDPATKVKAKVGHLVIGWEDGYPVRLNMMVQELNEILD